MRKYLFFVSLIIFITGDIEAKTIHIPADYTTIQEGIDSAVSGDVVLVSKGTYAGGINMKGGVHLKSEEGPGSTIISGGTYYIRSVIRCVNLTDTTLIDGFTIRDCNSHGTLGGGIYSYNSNMIIRNNIIRNNVLEALYYNDSSAGGGIYVGGGSALIENNIIRDNIADADDCPKNKKKSDYAYGGGGIYAEATMVTIKNNIIAYNSAIEASPFGGGIECVNCIKAVIFNNLIDSNYTSDGKWTEGFGAGILCAGPVEIINNTIVNNYLRGYNSRYGGGIYCFPGQDSIIIKNNIIAFDSASITGGGIYCDSLDSSKVFIGYNGFYLNAPDNFYNAPQGVGNFSWGTNRNGIPCDSFYNINIDPGFTTGTSGNYYQQNVSGCGDYIVNNEFGFLGGNTTDGKPDTGWVDLGYHYGTPIGIEEKWSEATSRLGGDQKSNIKIGQNPFIGITTICYDVPKEASVSVKIYDITGKCVKTLVDGNVLAGSYKETIDSKDYGKGVYFVKLSSDRYKETKKMVVIQ
ncbi:MAG: T9SS type A sorting domain-containing protein [bacterium]